ncbi:uncharacterized protein CEXT_753841 [Caerostris extrusa]|uniref:Uncharacterized protein n=1 Tax=Caerostris extrusa TaxID=172846 RepID=A0AAV4VK70_CAEEX|nr:uncharacterized protein CEXT_753841 [Caerostris extrusa]
MVQQERAGVSISNGDDVVVSYQTSNIRPDISPKWEEDERISNKRFSGKNGISGFNDIGLRRSQTSSGYKRTLRKSTEYKKVLSYLYTATLGRIYNIKEDTEYTLVVDASRYLEIVKGDIETLKEQKKAKNKAEIINKHKEEYRKSVQKKIEEAKGLIDSQITPEIDNISTQIDSKIDLLINETIELKEKAEEEKKLLWKRRD